MGHDQRDVPLITRSTSFILLVLLTAVATATADRDATRTRCGFGHERNLQHVQRLHQGIASVNPRPVLPFYADAATGRFRVHFTRTGIDAVPSLDANGNGLEDYVEETIRALDSAYHVEVNLLGYAPPPSDLDSGGSDALDIYLRNLSFERETGVYGVTRLETLSPNPERWDTYTTFIEIDNDFSPTDRNRYDSLVYKQTSGLEALRVTCAHELHHAIQCGTYGFTGVEFMVYEMTSTWMEQRVYPDVLDWHLHTSSLLRQPSLYAFSRDDAFAGYAWGWFGWVLHRQSDTLLRHAWHRIATGERPFTALVEACRDAGTSLSALFCDALPVLFQTGSRGEENAILAGATALPEIRYSVDELAEPPSVSIGNSIDPFGINALRFMIPGTAGSPVSTSLLVTVPDETALTERITRDISYNVLVTSSPLPSDLFVQGSSWSIRLDPADRLCTFISGQRTQRIEGPYPQPFVGGTDDALRFPVLSAKPGDKASLRVRGVGYGQPTAFEATVELDDDRLVIAWYGAASLGTGIYLVEINHGTTTTVHKVAIRR